MTRKQAALHGFGWGCIAGLALVALMYLANLFLGLRPLPQILNEPLLSLMPGFVFGFLIDKLQHAGKVLEEFGLIVAMIVALGVLGAVSSVASLRWTTQYLPFAFATVGWVVVVGALLPIGGSGLLGLNDGPATPIIWAATTPPMVALRSISTRRATRTRLLVNPRSITIPPAGATRPSARVRWLAR